MNEGDCAGCLSERLIDNILQWVLYSNGKKEARMRT
ncbi:hypothetical protein K1Y30_04830 [Staphylococcus arlettae]|nr:hypothetical protein [Staphylococcus arlettae]